MSIVDSLAARNAAAEAEARTLALASYRRLILASVEGDLDTEALDELASTLSLLQISAADADRDAATARSIRDLEARADSLSAEVEAARVKLVKLKAMEREQLAALSQTQTSLNAEEARVTA